MRSEWMIHSQVEHVLAALTPANRLVMRVCLHTGLRLSDVLELKTAALGPSMWVTEKKTGKRKQVGLPKPLLYAVKEQAGKEWAFPGRLDQSKHRTRQAVWADVKRAAKAFRMPQNVCPHSARKVYAVELRDKYGSMKRVQRALNHSSESVTMIYAMADKLLENKVRS